MKLFESLPDSVTVNGKRVRVDLDFRNVLKMMEILSRDDLMPEAREFLALKCICKRPRKGMMHPVRNLLFPGASVDHKKITDFAQDADLIRAAFMQEYRINLFRDKLHWFEFSCLLGCLPEGSKYMEILSIRTRPIPAPNAYNQNEIAWLTEAKARYGLELTEKEQKKQYSEDVRRIGAFLLSLAGEGENNG